MATTGKFWVTEPHQLAPHRMGESGRASLPARTVIDCFKDAVKKHGNERAMGLKRPVDVSSNISSAIFISIFVI